MTLLGILLCILIALGVALITAQVIALRRSRKSLEEVVRRIYQKGRQSVFDGICSGTSLDDAYIDKAVEQILEQCAKEKQGC